jgi:hypothetical protein
VALTDKRQTFVDAYLECWNASEAARIAGYAAPGQQGHRLLKDIEISDEIKRRVTERAMSADEVLIRLAAQARGSMDDFVSFRPGVKLPLLDLEKAHEAGKFGLVKKLKYTADGAVEFELYDAQAALMKLAQIHGLQTNKTEISGTLHLDDLRKLSDDELRAIVEG